MIPGEQARPIAGNVGVEAEDKAPPPGLVRDFLVFQLKLALDGLKDLLAFNLSILAVVADLVRGRRGESRFFYGVVTMSEGFERWLKLHRLRGRKDEILESWEKIASRHVPDADRVIDENEEMARRRMELKREARRGVRN